MENIKEKFTRLKAKEFLLSDKPPDRRMLRNLPTMIRWGYYFVMICIFLSALLITPNIAQVKVFLVFVLVLFFYLIFRFLLQKKKHWLLTEKATWIHGLGGIIILTIFYYLFRINGYGVNENDPANIWIVSLIPLGIVSRYGKTIQWLLLLVLNIILIVMMRFGFGVFFLQEEILQSINFFGLVNIPYPSPLYLIILGEVALISIASVGIHYAIRWRRMSQLKTNVQLSVFSELAGNLDVRKSYRTIAERIHRLDNMPVDYYPYVYIMLWNQDTNCLKVIGGAGKPEQFWKNVEINSGKGITGRAFFTQKIVNEGNVKLLPAEEYCCPEGHDDVHSEMAIPIFYKDQRLGVLDVQSPNKNEFGNEDENFLKIIADGIGIAIANSMHLDTKIGKALQVSDNVLEASEKISRLRFWFSEIAKAGNEYIGADHLFLFRLSPGLKYPIKPVLSWPKIADTYYDNLWPIPSESFFWKLVREWKPVYGLEINNETTLEEADSWANRFVKSEDILTVAFLPIGESYPLACLFVCYKEEKIFSDIDRLALKTFTSSLERAITRVEVEPYKSAGKTIHNVLIPETLGVLGELENIENNAENRLKVLFYVESTRNRIMNLRKKVVLATVGAGDGDYEYVPKKQTLKSALIKISGALNAGQNKRVTFDINGTEEIENEDSIFLEIMYELISEAMGNSVVHGKARRVSVDVVNINKCIELSITDDGIGLENNHSKYRPHGIYFWKKYLRSRFGVHLTITNLAMGGVKIFARFSVLPID